MGDLDSGMHNACSFALESPLKGCASRFTGPNCSTSASSTKRLRGSTQCGVDSGAIGRPE